MPIGGPFRRRLTTSTLGVDYFWTPIMAYFSAPIDRKGQAGALTVRGDAGAVTAVLINPDGPVSRDCPAPVPALSPRRRASINRALKGGRKHRAATSVTMPAAF